MPLSTDPRKFWGFVRSKKGSTGILGLVCYNNSEISDASAIVNAFGDYFNSVFIQSSPFIDNTICTNYTLDTTISVNTFETPIIH